MAIRLRGVDTDERGQHRWHAARDELRRRTTGQALAVLPHHDSHRRVVADVPAAGVDVGAAMDAAGLVEGGVSEGVGRRRGSGPQPVVIRSGCATGSCASCFSMMFHIVGGLALVARVSVSGAVGFNLVA